MNNSPQISVVINTYNAERHLEAVLRSVKDFDEILVCDMQSTDRTVDIARQHGCRIVTFEKKHYTIVEPARQFAIDQARCPWVLVLDADELVSPALKDYLYAHIRRPHCAAGLTISWVDSSTPPIPTTSCDSSEKTSRNGPPSFMPPPL